MGVPSVVLMARALYKGEGWGAYIKVRGGGGTFGCVDGEGAGPQHIQRAISVKYLVNSQ